MAADVPDREGVDRLALYGCCKIAAQALTSNAHGAGHGRSMIQRVRAPASGGKSGSAPVRRNWPLSLRDLSAKRLMDSRSDVRTRVQFVDRRILALGVAKSSARSSSFSKSFSALNRRPLLPREKVGGSKTIASNRSFRWMSFGMMSSTSSATNRWSAGDKPLRRKFSAPRSIDFFERSTETVSAPASAAHTEKEQV